MLTLCLVATGLSASAQESRITEHELSKNQQYLDAQGFSRLQTDLVYIDRLEGEIPMDGAPAYKPPEPPPERVDDRPVEITNQVLLGLILAIAIFLAWKFGRPVLERWGFVSRNIRRGHETWEARQVGPVVVTDPDLIARLRGMADREAALIQLLEAVLPAAAGANGMRLTRSETARELLRRLPASWPHMADLRRIVMTEELVQFGGRPLAEESFLDCLDRAVPILRGAAA